MNNSQQSTTSRDLILSTRYLLKIISEYDTVNVKVVVKKNKNKVYCWWV